MGPLFPDFLPISFSDTFFYLVKKSIPRHFQDDRQCLSLPGYLVPPRSYSETCARHLYVTLSVGPSIRWLVGHHLLLFAYSAKLRRAKTGAAVYTTWLPIETGQTSIIDIRKDLKLSGHGKLRCVI